MLRCASITVMLCALLLCQAPPALAQEPGESVPPLGGVIDHAAPGLLRVGDVQFAWGVTTAPCPPPANFCQVRVDFPLPFAEKPVVFLTDVTSPSTEKSASASLYQELVKPTSFTARVNLEANVKALKQIPWMAVGRWR